MKVLVVVDMQNDFISGVFGSDHAKAVVSKVSEKIRNWDGDIIVTQDTHRENYPDTNEGKNIPIVHCRVDTQGWEIDSNVMETLETKRTLGTSIKNWCKGAFGDYDLAAYIAEKSYDSIEFVGVCTDMCVLSNAIITRAKLPEASITVDASCCAGNSPEDHRKALDIMKLNLIQVVHDETI